MHTITKDPRETEFLEQRHLFLSQALTALGYSSADELHGLPKRIALPLPPVIIHNYRNLKAGEITGIIDGYNGENAVSHFIILNPEDKSVRPHPALDFAAQLVGALPLANPINHPMEGHPEAVSRFGPPDGTLKIYDLSTRDGKAGYRELAETSEMFDAHNDGLGYGGV